MDLLDQVHLWARVGRDQSIANWICGYGKATNMGQELAVEKISSPKTYHS